MKMPKVTKRNKGISVKRNIKLVAIMAGLVGLAAGVFGMQRNDSNFSLVAGLFAAVAGLLTVRAGRDESAIARGFKDEASGVSGMVITSGEMPMHLQPSDEPVHHELTGLFNESYFRATIDTRVLAAKRHLRPVSVALIAVSDGPDRRRTADLVKVAHAIKATLRDSDIACHLDDGRFAFILEDTPEDGAVWTLERLRRAIAEVDTNMVQWAGIACYPAHAFNSAELLTKSEEALKTAWDWPQARIEVASAS
jgi:GGDEF domain-containing protein